jgi:hypothetical protein
MSLYYFLRTVVTLCVCRMQRLPTALKSRLPKVETKPVAVAAAC